MLRQRTRHSRSGSVEMDYLLILTFFCILMMVIVARATDLIFIYFQHLALPVSLPIP